jgi:glycosyltransferase involved in cell wall biosynthesis
MTARLEVFIPAYHPPELVEQCLQSVARQTLPLESVTVVDDCSPYDLTAVAARYPAVRFLRNERNLGIGGNLNRCLELATADFFTYLHSDDMLAPDWHRVWRERLDAAPPEADLFMSGSAVVDAESRVVSVHRFGSECWCAGFPENIRRLWGWKCYGVTFSASLLYRRTFFDRFGAFPIARYPNNSDVEINLRGLLESRLLYTPEILFYFRRHAGQSVCQSDVQAAETARAIFTDLAARYREPLAKAGVDLAREPLAIYQLIALAWLFRGDRSRWRAYRAIGAAGNPRGLWSPWTWGYAVELLREYRRRAGLVPLYANRETGAS